MVCNSCGRNNINESANFCEYCGASFRESNVQDNKSTYNYSYQGGPGNASAQVPPPMPMQAIDINKNEKPVSFLNWLGTYFIMFIPFVGGLVLFVMLIVWSLGGSNVAESKKNWARATLVMMIILFIIIMIFVVMFIMMLRDPVFQDMFNNEMNQYNDIFKNYSY